MNRASVLLRSVLPQDLTQLLLLSGVICLVIAPHLRWGPQGQFSTPIMLFIGFGLYAIYFAGTAGFFTCFRPGRHPVRRILCWVCLPALMGECSLMFSSFAFLITRQAPGSISLQNINASQVLSALGPGFHYAAVGSLFVVAFTIFLALGSTSLPLVLPKPSVSVSNDFASWNRLTSFLWVFLALLPLILWLWFPPFINFILGHYIFLHLPPFKGVDIVSLSANATTDLIIALIGIRMIGREARDALRRSLCWPKVKCLALAVVFPLGIDALVSVGLLIFKLLRVVTNQHSSALRLSQFDYFMFPRAGLFLWWLLPAFTEEIIFRGMLQPLFVRRYGVSRGVFLVGITFAAAHVSTDFSGGYTDSLVIAKLCSRLIASLALSLVFGWLTLRRGSIFPAAIAHGLYNISSSFVPPFAGIGLVIDLLWMMLAYVLFHYWPVQTEAKQEFESAAPLPQV